MNGIYLFENNRRMNNNNHFCEFYKFTRKIYWTFFKFNDDGKFGKNNIIDDSMCFQSILVGASKQETWSLITYVNQLIILIEELFSLFLLVLFFFFF